MSVKHFMYLNNSSIQGKYKPGLIYPSYPHGGFGGFTSKDSDSVVVSLFV